MDQFSQVKCDHNHSSHCLLYFEKHHKTMYTYIIFHHLGVVKCNLLLSWKVLHFRLSRARMVVENAFGRLKGRFRLLKKQCDCDLNTVLSMVSAAVTLHNICEMREEVFDPQWGSEEENTDVNGGETATNGVDGRGVRDALMRHINITPLP